jgi:phospholipid N-methyltransferase
MNGADDTSIGRSNKGRSDLPGQQGLTLAQPASGWQERLTFLGAFLRRPGRIGAIGPSSAALAEVMLHGCNLKEADTVVELGPGTGAFTAHILKRMGRKTTFLAIELDPTCVSQLCRRFPGLKVHQESAGNLPKLLPLHGKTQVDCVISGLPWANMPLGTQQQVLSAVVNSIRHGGVFQTFAYVHACWFPTARRFRQMLEASFPQVTKSPIVWKNLPPAFVYHCVR